MGDNQAQVLVVCTGNICRSPLIERLLQASLDVGSVRVRSAGTHAMVGEPMTAQTAAEVTRLGGLAEGHVARRLTAAMLAEADLVLTATLAHRAAVANLLPRAVRYTFTLRELGRLLEQFNPSQLPQEPAQRVRALPAAAAARRGQGPAPAPGADDVTDPIGGNGAVYRRTTEQILPALTRLVRVLTGRSLEHAAEGAVERVAEPPADQGAGRSAPDEARPAP